MLRAGDPKSIGAPTLQIYVLPFIIPSSARGSAAEIKRGGRVSSRMLSRLELARGELSGSC